MYQKSFFLSALFFTAALQSGDANAEATFDHRGVRVSFDKPDARLQIGGRLHLDGLTSSEELFGDDTAVRRARVDASFQLGKKLKFKLDRDFAPDRSGWRNVWGQVRHDAWRFRIGQFVTPFSIEEIMESNNLAFSERALSSALAPSFRTGVSASRRADKWSVTGAVMRNPINNGSRADDGVSYVTRGVYTPIRKKNQVVHIAGAIEYRDLADDATTRVQSGHEISLRNVRRLRGGRIRNANGYLNSNIELAYMTRNVLVQSQVLSRRIYTPEGNPTSVGGYVQASYLFGRAKRKYSPTLGAFGAVVPRSKRGVVEASARISHLNLRDNDGHVGDETALTGGLSWYASRNVRFIVSATYTDINNNRRDENLSGVSGQGRIQVAF